MSAVPPPDPPEFDEPQPSTSKQKAKAKPKAKSKAKPKAKPKEDSAPLNSKQRELIASGAQFIHVYPPISGCAVFKCPGQSLFLFPIGDPHLNRQWLEFCHLGGVYNESLATRRLCSLHFEASQFLERGVLRPDAIPTIERFIHPTGFDPKKPTEAPIELFEILDQALMRRAEDAEIITHINQF